MPAADAARRVVVLKLPNPAAGERSASASASDVPPVARHACITRPLDHGRLGGA